MVSRYAYCVSPTWGGGGGGLGVSEEGGNTGFLVERGGGGRDLVVSEDGGEHMVSGRTGGEGYQSSLTEYKWGTIEN